MRRLPAVCAFLMLIVSVRHDVFAQEAIFYSPESRHWADSVMKKMTYEEKIGQLFMVAAWSNKDSVHVNYIKGLIDSLKIGGLLFFQGGPVRQAALTNFYQKRSRIPLLISIDGEWGLSMRLDSTIRFPRQMTLSAAADDSLIYLMGKEIGRQCRQMGIHVNFAPVVDINNNPLNPVINSRSFGEDKYAVARYASNYMQGMQDEHVLACAKHFPGHGNTDTDSHFSLPVINQTAGEIDSVELFPFRQLFRRRLGSVMVAHLQIPSIDSTAGVASTLSRSIVDDLLQKKLRFNGLVFTDALDMKGVASYFTSGDLELKALLAGNDVLLNTENVYAAFNRIHYAIQNCEIEQEVIDGKVRKILMAKYWCGLDHYEPVETSGLAADLLSEDAQWLNYRLYEKSLTLLRNDKLIPVRPFENKRIASLVINDVKDNLFQQTLNTYAKVDCYSMAADASGYDIKELYILLKEYDLVIVSVHNTSTNASKNFNITPAMQEMVNRLSSGKFIICVFGNPYTIGKFSDIVKYGAVVLGYEDTFLPQYFGAQMVFGGNSFKGTLPVSINDEWKRGQGKELISAETFKLTLPQEVARNTEPIAFIDSLVETSILDSVFPGCQVLAARDGKIFYEKAFGNPVYDDNDKVRLTDLYDIASVTKIVSTALATMYLYERKKLNPAAKISRYLPELKKTNKANILLGDLLAHQAGLQAWIPFYKKTLTENGLSAAVFSRHRDSIFTVPVTDSLWMTESYKDVIWKELLDSPVEPRGKYIYSDLGLIILQRIIEKITGCPLNEFVQEHFYEPLGIWRITYRPLEKFNRSEIIPTEYDTVFRRQLIHGTVHDPAAAMMGGVGGHAGLFSNAHSLSVVMQMLMNYGIYNGKRYFKKETVELFTSQVYPGTSNRRGLLFDKPSDDPSNSPAAASASSFAFGHAGFTGTCAWADPEKRLVYIFLSNRVYPSAENNELARRNIRTDIMQLFYESLAQKKD